MISTVFKGYALVRLATYLGCTFKQARLKWLRTGNQDSIDHGESAAYFSSKTIIRDSSFSQAWAITVLSK